MAASTRLTLVEVEKELNEVSAADWFSLGVQLGIKPAKLREIEKDHPGDVQRCKTEVLDRWHRNAQDISKKKLAQALEAMGGYVHLVQRLERSGTYALDNPHVIQMNGTSFHPELESSSPNTNGHCHSGKEEGGNIYDDTLTKEPFHGCRGVSIYEPDLELETHELRSQFNVLFTKVRRSLEQQGVKVDDFVSFLKGVPAYTAGEQSLFSAELPGLYQKRSLTRVFEVIRDYTSWFNYSFISNIIDTYCESDVSIKKTLQKFQQLLQKYCEHRVCKCSPRNGFLFGRKRACAHMVLKIDKEWKTIRVKQVEEVTSNLARILKVHRRALYLRSVENGCVQLTFIVSNILAAAIFPLSPEQEAQLVEMSVILLHCGDHQFLNPLLGFSVATPSYNLTVELISCTELLLSSNGHVLELFHTGDEEMLQAALNLWVHYFFHPQSFLVSRISHQKPAERLNVKPHNSKGDAYVNSEELKKVETACADTPAKEKQAKTPGPDKQEMLAKGPGPAKKKKLVKRPGPGQEKKHTKMPSSISCKQKTATPAVRKQAQGSRKQDFTRSTSALIRSRSIPEIEHPILLEGLYSLHTGCGCSPGMRLHSPESPRMVQYRPRSSSCDCVTVVKRGYLREDRAGNLLERKQWYVLRADHAQRYCVLEYYKEEKSAEKGEAPKGFIRVHFVQRVADKKQMFEIFGSDVSCRLMANSETEADEWIDALRKVIMLSRKRHVTYWRHPLLYPHLPTYRSISDSLQHSLPTPIVYTSSTHLPTTEPPVRFSRALEVLRTLSIPITSSESRCRSSDMQSFDSDSESSRPIHSEMQTMAQARSLLKKASEGTLPRVTQYSGGGLSRRQSSLPIQHPSEQTYPQKGVCHGHTESTSKISPGEELRAVGMVGRRKLKDLLKD